MAIALSGYVLPVAIGAVFVVLIFGLVNMMRGGDAGRSQTLMRWRVILQFAAIVIIMGTLWAMGSRP